MPSLLLLQDHQNLLGEYIQQQSRAEHNSISKAYRDPDDILKSRGRGTRS
jgi:hypothetical protein